jgi:hypothetical protein
MKKENYYKEYEEAVEKLSASMKLALQTLSFDAGLEESEINGKTVLDNLEETIFEYRKITRKLGQMDREL